MAVEILCELLSEGGRDDVRLGVLDVIMRASHSVSRTSYKMRINDHNCQFNSFTSILGQLFP